MDIERDYYSDLGVLPDVSREAIRVAYVSLAKRFHPDSGNEFADEDKLKRINAAYEILYDDNTRRKYDKERSAFSRNTRSSDVGGEETQDDYENKVGDEADEKKQDQTGDNVFNVKAITLWSTIKTVLKLITASLFVGLIFTLFDITLKNIIETLVLIFKSGMYYLLSGLLIVLPSWLVIRIWWKKRNMT